MEQDFDLPISGVEYAIIEVFAADEHFVKRLAPSDVLRPIMVNHREMMESLPDLCSIITLTDFYSRLPSWIVGMSKPYGSGAKVKSWGLPEELNLGDPKQLGNLFLKRALETFSGIDHLAVGFKGHGDGLFGKILRDASHPDEGLTVSEVRELLRASMETTVRRGDPRRKLDLLFTDVCSFGWIEVLCEFESFADCMITTEGTAPVAGWQYGKWLKRMEQQAQEHPTARKWAEMAVDTYETYGRDDLGLCAFETKELMPIASAFRGLVDVLDRIRGSFPVVQGARPAEAVSESDGAYDLWAFCSNLHGTLADSTAGNEGQRREGMDACEQILEAVRRARIGEPRGAGNPEATCGMAFWFPRDATDLASHKAVYQNLEFNRVTKWLDYLDQGYAQPWERRVRHDRRSHGLRRSVPPPA